MTKSRAQRDGKFPVRTVSLSCIVERIEGRKVRGDDFDSVPDAYTPKTAPLNEYL